MTSDAFKSWYEKLRATGDIAPVRLGCSRDEVLPGLRIRIVVG
jgi:hypothetical protein